MNLYARRWPGALVVHLDTDHSARPIEVLPGIPAIADFRTALGVSDAVGSATAGGP